MDHLHDSFLRPSTLGLAFTFALLLAGCATAASPSNAACADAADKIAMCTGVEITTDGCDASRAEAVLATDCEKLVEAAGKADCGFFTPWDCWNLGGSSGGGSTQSAEAQLTVHVTECTAGIFDDCPAVSGMACTRVVVEDSDGAQVASAFTNEHGNVRFSGLDEDAEYRVKVVRRTGAVSVAQLDQYTNEYGPSDTTLTLTAGTDVDFTLRRGEREQVYACAMVDVHMNVVSASGAAIDPHAIEWDWIATFENEDVTEYRRSYRSEGETSSSFGLYNLRPGHYSVTYHRVQVPDDDECSWYSIGAELHYGGRGFDTCRLPNRNNHLLEAFEVDSVEPATFEFTVETAQIGHPGEIVDTPVFELVDPLTE